MKKKYADLLKNFEALNSANDRGYLRTSELESVKQQLAAAERKMQEAKARE